MNQKTKVIGIRLNVEISNYYDELASARGQKTSHYLRDLIVSNLTYARLKLMMDDLQAKLDHVIELQGSNYNLYEKSLSNRLEDLEKRMSIFITDNAFPKQSEEFLTTLFFLNAINTNNLEKTLDFHKREVAGKTLFDDIVSDSKQIVSKRRSNNKG